MSKGFADPTCGKCGRELIPQGGRFLPCHCGTECSACYALSTRLRLITKQLEQTQAELKRIKEYNESLLRSAARHLG